MELYEIRPMDSEIFEVPLSQIVRIYRGKGKITFTDGSVVRVRPNDIDRLKAALMFSRMKDDGT